MFGFETEGNTFCKSCGLLEIYTEEEKKKGVMTCGFCSTENLIVKTYQQCSNCWLVEIILDDEREKGYIICGECKLPTPISNEEEYIMCTCGLKELIIEGDRERGYSICGLCNEQIEIGKV